MDQGGSATTPTSPRGCSTRPTSRWCLPGLHAPGHLRLSYAVGCRPSTRPSAHRGRRRDRWCMRAVARRACASSRRSRAARRRPRPSPDAPRPVARRLRRSGPTTRPLRTASWKCAAAWHTRACHGGGSAEAGGDAVPAARRPGALRASQALEPLTVGPDGGVLRRGGVAAHPAQEGAAVRRVTVDQTWRCRQ